LGRVSLWRVARAAVVIPIGSPGVVGRDRQPLALAVGRPWNVSDGVAINEVMESETDRELIRRSREQPSCFEGIFDRHAPAIYRFLRLRVGDELAEELAAETFTRAFHARNRYESRHGSALPWLFGIAANLIRMHRRAERRRLRAYAWAASPEVGQGSVDDSDARVDAAALAPVLARALAALSPSEREVLLLHAWGGLTSAEVAQALGIGSGAARKRLHRARVRAAQHLERCGDGEAADLLPTRSST
jgi:RNA polymerase sigma factor (sigma-70 family)